jgi:hypothetical protein
MAGWSIVLQAATSSACLLLKITTGSKEDGTVNVTMNPSAGSRTDFIAVDYAELIIEITPVPEPCRERARQRRP